SSEIDTDDPCDALVSQGAGLPDVCAIARAQIPITGPIKALWVHGSRPLALLADGQLLVDAGVVIDLRSQPPMLAAGVDPGCTSNSGAAGSFSGPGGGAGGTSGTQGGLGGAPLGGNQAMPLFVDLSYLHGGCSGGAGGTSTITGGGGAGGA